MKIDITNLEEVLYTHGVKPEKVEKIIQDLTKVTEELKEEREKTDVPKAKYEWTLIISDPNNELDGKELTGWPCKVLSGRDVGMILSDVSEVSREFNETRSGKKSPVRSFGEAIMYVKRKFFKPKNLNFPSKEPVRVLITNNKLV